MKFKSYENEFKIDNIYIKLYNKDPQWKINDCDFFIENIKNCFLKYNETSTDYESSELSEKNVDMINAMVNCIQFSKANEKILTNDKNFAEKLISILKVKNYFKKKI